MEKLVDKIVNCDFEELKSITFPKNELFGLNVNKDGIKYEFLLNIKDNVDKLLILGSVARRSLSPEDRKRPWFHRGSWAFEESTIHYNDPTTYIHPDLTMGWGIGTKNKWYLKEIALIIKEIGVKIKIPQKNMIFLGTSEGGFTSLMLSTLINDSICISEMPQFNVKDYGGGGHWNLLKEHIFLNMTDEEIFEKYGHRVDVITLFNKTNYIPKSYLILDCSVEGDLKYNYIPFLKRLNELPYNEFQNNLKIRIDGKNKGHCGSDYLSTRETIKKIIYLEYGGKSYLDYIVPSNGFSVINREENGVEFSNGKHSIFVYENFNDDIETAIKNYKNKFQNADITEKETIISYIQCTMVSLQADNHFEYSIFLSRKNVVYSIKSFTFEKEVQKTISKIIKILN